MLQPQNSCVTRLTEVRARNGHACAHARLARVRTEVDRVEVGQDSAVAGEERPRETEEPVSSVVDLASKAPPAWPKPSAKDTDA